MANVATLIPGATQRVQTLKAAVRDLSVAHGKDSQDLASGPYQTISAFGDRAGRTMEILEGLDRLEQIRTDRRPADLVEQMRGLKAEGKLTPAVGPMLSGLRKLGGKIWGGIKRLFGGPSQHELAATDTEGRQ